MGQIIVDKPTGGEVDKEKAGYVYLENKTIRIGEPIGLLLCLTYPETVNFIGERI